jgi:hypothetical protein
MVSVNDGEASKVKFLDTDLLLTSTSLTTSSLTTLTPFTTNAAAVATFPNVIVNAGEEYRYVCCLLET